MGGLSYLKSKEVKSFANQKTINIANEKDLPVPQYGFSDSLTIHFQDIPVECYYLGGGHTIDNILIWLPTEDILFGGCCIKDLNSINLGNLSDADIAAWPVTMQKIKEKFTEPKIVIPGHGAVGGCELIQHTIELLEN